MYDFSYIFITFSTGGVLKTGSAFIIAVFHGGIVMGHIFVTVGKSKIVVSAMVSGRLRCIIYPETTALYAINQFIEEVFNEWC